MPVHDLKEQISRLPEQPGVYLWSNAAGEALYVGKARSLRDRVRSYLGAYGLSPRHDALLDEVARLEVIVTDSVMEALALENNLIKQRTPKYNILLRDDKNYPYLQLTTSEAFPRVLVARSVEKGADFYAGPFLPAKLARRTMTLAHRLFGIRSCNEVITGRRARPCLEYDIKRCIAPCVAEICTEERYGDAVASTRLLLEGRNDELAETLRERMADAAAGERFEEAAQLRDAMRTVQILRDRQQKVATAQLGDRDVFGLKLGPSGGALQVFAMRGGRVVERVELATDPGVSGVAESEVLQAALTQFYELRVPPAEVNLPVEIEDADAMEEWLSQQAGRRVKILVPQRGDKRALVELATRNAELSYRTRFNEMTAAHFDALETLRSVLGLSSLPRRIECFDISTIQGSETVAAMVVCEDGRMKKSEYRKFRVRGNRGLGTRDRGLGDGDSGLGTGDSGFGTGDSGLGTGDSGLGAGDPGLGTGDSGFGAGDPGLGTGDSGFGAGDSGLGTRDSGLLTEDPAIGIDPAAGYLSPGSAVPSPATRVPDPQPAALSPGSPVTAAHSRPTGPDSRFLNDFAAMREVVRRRYQKVMADGGPFPDLILIDGGKGQLSAAYEALEEIGLGNLVAAGIAKKEELLFTRDSSDPIVLPESDPALLLIQRIRDEAHRFAVTFHRKARSMRDLRSELDSVPGIGPRRRRALLTAFGSLSGVRRATREELESVVGAKTATAVIDYFAHAH